MSQKTITKEVNAIICDFCGLEVNTKSDDYCYHRLPSTSGKTFDTRKYGVKHFLFRWRRDNGINTDTYVQYDFHADCFDKLMQGFLKQRKESQSA